MLVIIIRSIENVNNFKATIIKTFKQAGHNPIVSYNWKNPIPNLLNLLQEFYVENRIRK